MQLLDIGLEVRTSALFLCGGVQTPVYLLQLMRVKAEWDTITHERCKKTECVILDWRCEQVHSSCKCRVT
jgi:hypothetical protein